MKPQTTWRFSAPLSQVDVPRIAREAGVHIGNVVRVTVDGTVYTMWREDLHQHIPVENTSLGEPVYVDACTSVFRDHDDDGGRPRITGSYHGAARIQFGDYVGRLRDRVRVDVEVF